MHSISSPIAGFSFLRLQLFLKSDGTADVSGFFHTGTQRLTARTNEPAQASCADLDLDGVAGLTDFVARFSPQGAREHALLAKGTPNREIDEPGNYELVMTDIETGRTLFTGAVRVAVGDMN